MDGSRFDALNRALGQTLSRRRLSGLLSGSGLGVLGLLGATDPVAAACDPPCGVCQRCRDGRCKPKPNDTPCKVDGRCLNGRCNPRPTCDPAGTDCSSSNLRACCSRVCATVSSSTGKCALGDTDTKCFTGSDCIGGRCIGYRCRGKVDCSTKPDGTLCAADRACRGGACVGCWEDTNDLCCSIQNGGQTCIRPAICHADQCISCTSDLWCEDRCLPAGCENQCGKSCTSPSDCCGALTCQPVQDQFDPNKHRCLPT